MCGCAGLAAGLQEALSVLETTFLGLGDALF
jgi:hypothetical protein